MEFYQKFFRRLLLNTTYYVETKEKLSLNSTLAKLQKPSSWRCSFRAFLADQQKCRFYAIQIYSKK
jgi:hypothetical protein